jgi:serine/threonine-protein kinase
MTAVFRDLGRYRLYEEIAVGGMAAVHLGRLVGPVGFARTVAIKRLHPQFARDPAFVAMFLEEARLASRIQHPNVVGTLDVVALEGELFHVMDYVHGESLARLLRHLGDRGQRVPLRIAVAIIHQALLGLHAAHEARGDGGVPLEIIHRDISPQNLLVGAEGVTRIADFGVARAGSHALVTEPGHLKGKLAYMAPEQLRLHPANRRSDLFSMGVVLWEVLVGTRLFAGDSPAAVAGRVLHGSYSAPSRCVRGLNADLDEVVMRALSRDPEERFTTARDMAASLEAVVIPAGPLEVADWVSTLSGPELARRSQRITAIEVGVDGSGPRESTFVGTVRLPEPGPESRRTGTRFTVAFDRWLGRPRRPSRSGSALATGSVALIIALAFSHRVAQVQREHRSAIASVVEGAAPASQPSYAAAARSAAAAIVSVQPSVGAARSSVPAAPGAARAAAQSERGQRSLELPNQHVAGREQPSRGARAPLARGGGPPPTGTSQRAAPPATPGALTRAAGRATAAACDPPWRLRADGVKEFKLGCFQ